MKRKLLYSLMTLALVSTASCGSGDDSSDVASNTSSDSSTTNQETPSSSESVTSSTTTEENSFESVSSVDNLFKTYQTAEDFNYILDYTCNVVTDREYFGGWETTYWYDGLNIQLDYESGSAYYTDYVIYDEEQDLYFYYLDNGQKQYQYLDQNDENFFNYYGLVDPFDISDIDWVSDFVYDLENKQMKPRNAALTQEIGEHIFGSVANEFWDTILFSYDNGHITGLEAISIYQKSAYYYTIELDGHDYVSILPPDNSIEYKNPYEPYFKGEETYTGVALTEAQAAALTMFSSEFDMNYTSDVTYNPVRDGVIDESTSLTFNMKADKGLYEYTYDTVDQVTQQSITCHDFVYRASETTAPIYYSDDGYQNYQPYYSSMTDYSSYMSQFYLDVTYLYGLDPSDFIYDESKGYITAKNEATEANYCGDIFTFDDGYAGLRIYLKENDDNSLSIDKIVTSMYAENEDGSYFSFVKTYTYSNFNATTVTLPEMN